MELINISNLYYKYHKTDVLENINLSIKDDDFLAIIGPNGGGKSTLLKIFMERVNSYSLSWISSRNYKFLKNLLYD